MEDRRAGERRGDDRREFRRDEGRRVAGVWPRRGVVWVVRPSLILAVPLLLGVLYQLQVVEPRQALEGRVGLWGEYLRTALESMELQGVALPGAPLPLNGDPSAPITRLSPEQAGQLRVVLGDLGPGRSRAGAVPAFFRVAAVAELLLGEDRKARRDFEELLTSAVPAQKVFAYAGLAAVALRAAGAATDPGDRVFACRLVQRYLDAAEELGGPGPALAFNRALALQLEGRLEEAEVVAQVLPMPQKSLFGRPQHSLAAEAAEAAEAP